MRKSLLVWGGLILLFLLLVGEMGKFGTSSSAREVSYSQFLDRVDNGEVQSAAIDLQNARISFTDRSGARFTTNNPEATDTRALIGDLRANKVNISSEPLEKKASLPVSSLICCRFCCSSGSLCSPPARFRAVARAARFPLAKAAPA